MEIRLGDCCAVDFGPEEFSEHKPARKTSSTTVCQDLLGRAYKSNRTAFVHYFFLTAFLTADFAATALAGVGFAATAVFAAFGAGLVDALGEVDLGAVFFASTAFLVAGAAVLAAFFLTAFWVVTGPSLAAFLEALPPKIPFQPSEYFSLVPTRVIVTESPFYPN